MIYNETLNGKVCNSYIICIVLFVIFLIISIIISISSVSIYFHWYLKKDNIRAKFNTNTQTTIS